MHIPAIAAFVTGIVLGIWFRPFSLVAAVIVLVASVVLFGPRFDIPPILGSITIIVALNLGYLAGALVTRLR